jgi:acyl-coenzyme A synthetase/AMP-(fatty) acid ligase
VAASLREMGVVPGDRVAAYLPNLGELVITEPMPSMPHFLWKDRDFARYRRSYFDADRGVCATAIGCNSPRVAAP